MPPSSFAETAARGALKTLTRSLYRLRVQGVERIPSKGPALLVANHLSLADGFLIGTASPRPVRFLIWRPYYDAQPWRWVVRLMRAIPVAESDGPKGILRSLSAAKDALAAGEVVCIFAEGQISRTGNLLEFKKGFEFIMKGSDAPIIPIHLDRVWGSVFSFEHGRVIFKRPRQIPYPVTVTVGAPMPANSSAAAVRQAMLDLGAEAFVHRLDEKEVLPLEFVKTAKRQPRAMAVADSSGKELSFATLAATSLVFARILKTVLPSPSPRSGERGQGGEVGVLLPSSVAGAITNIALPLAGFVPVNLNYTAGLPAIQTAVEKAGIERILTSRKLLEKTGLPATPAMVFVEDLLALLPKPKVALERSLFALLPLGPLLRRYSGMLVRDTSQIATIMFSSGSTGVPKGVVLTHRNILANVLGLSQVFDVGRKDRMIGVLPFFHSFGFTGTIWFPMVAGFASVFHNNPLDAKTIGELAGRHRASLILATPTFLMAYIRKCTPEQFKAMRYVITGAERLRESIAKAFQDKFGMAPLEGYGCTELSPVATANVPDVSMGEIRQVGHKAGMIGHPIPGVSVRIVDPETYEPLAQGEKGLLLVKGQNVMKGYLGEPEKTAAVIRDGWYVTGDIARIDQDGFVQIVDRLTRFSKIGGEMVPHVLVEEKLHQVAARTEPTFVVTAVPDEKRGEQLVVLYVATFGSAEDVSSLYKKLQDSDLPKLWIPAKENFFAIEAIPLLGSGKMDLGTLKNLAQTKMGGTLS